MLEVILKTDVENLGDRGDVVRVANGYARNYLFPQQLAIPATAATRRQIEEMRAAAAREASRLRGEAEKLGAELDGMIVKIVAKAGDQAQLFGSVTVRDLAAKLAEMGVEIDRRKILLERPIRMLGEHPARVRLYKDVEVTLRVQVFAEGREEELYVPPEEKALEEVEEAAPAEEQASAAEGESAAVEAAEKSPAEEAASGETAAGETSAGEPEASEEAASEEALLEEELEAPPKKKAKK